MWTVVNTLKFFFRLYCCKKFVLFSVVSVVCFFVKF